MPEYEILRLLWWAVLGVLLIGVAVMDGFDMGATILLPIVGRTQVERRIVINAVGPVWEGNQVWLILGAGAVFAAWPAVYAVAFSGFYLAMLLLLCALILRPVGFKYRSKIEDARWRSMWDWALFVGGLVPALVFGVAFGNILLGVPFRFDDTLRMTYEGSLPMLFTPFALLCGLVSLAMLTMHGAAYLSCKTEGIVRDRARRAGKIAAGTLLALFTAGGLWASQLDGYVQSSVIDPSGPSNPLNKTVTRVAGTLLDNYGSHNWMVAAPIAGYVGAAMTAFLAHRKSHAGFAFIASATSLAGVIATAGVSLFPFMLPSSLDPDDSLTVFDASSSQTTLGVITIATGIFLPIVLLYTAWVYRVLRGTVTSETIRAEPQAY